MRHTLFIGMVLVLVTVLSGCISTADSEEEQQGQAQEPQVRRPVLLDHKNYQFGEEIPEWVMMEASEIEEMEEYEDKYVFKFESPRSQSLEGARLWTRNFEAASQLAQTVRNRVEVTFAGSAVGDTDFVENYMEQVVSSVSEAQFSGFRPVAEYWIQMRYFTPEGDVEEDAYTYYVLYTIDESTLDGMIDRALEEAAQEVTPQTDEEQRARQRVEEAFDDGLR
jgi:hypothetical protein